MLPTPPTDPREVITLESFAIDPSLLGLPLARPLRRAAAMAIDLLIIVLLVHAGGLLFAVASAWLLWRMSGRKAAHGILRRSWRFAFRSLAAIVLFVVVVSSWGFWRGPDRESTHGPAGGHPIDAELAMTAAGTSLPPDTVAWLEARVSQLEAMNRELRDSENEPGRVRGVLALMRTVADELGLGFGWSGLYFTAFIVLGRGQTPGKRLLRIRVLRLDGKPMSWWSSFERFGGYAACIFTGLLGFAQMVWDRNRQGMHDKISETVVVRL